MDDMSLLFVLDDETTIRSKAVVKITLASTTDHGKPKPYGLMDARMGSTDRAMLCQTCQQPHCAGHYGMIELPYRVYLVGQLKRIVLLLRSVCGACCKPLFTEAELKTWNTADLKRTERLKCISEKCRAKSECQECHSILPDYVEDNRIFIKRVFTDFSSMEPEEADFYRNHFTAEDAYSILEKISAETYLHMGIDIKVSHPKNAVPRCILVLPPAQRPTLRLADCGKTRGEDDMTLIYQDIVRAKLEVEAKQESLQGHGLENPALYILYCKLQLMVACIGNAGLRKLVSLPGVVDHASRGMVRILNGLQKRLSGKTGRFRSSLGANRTDFSARTVVGIDMVKNIWTLGVPKCRMKILTQPVRVTDINMEMLQKKIILGAHAERGANTVIQPQDSQAPRIISLVLMSEDQRCALAASLRIGWIVEKHLETGDWVWFNRQPTLHRMNMMAFQIYPVPGLTFRLPLPCTRPFNADYDGDEMNLHVPQTIEASAEAATLMNVAENMISPSSTTAIVSLVQESLVAWYRLTSRNSLLTRDLFFQLASQLEFDPHSPDYDQHPQLCSSSTYFPPIPQPAILKSPKGQRWTGKQVCQLLLPSSLTLIKSVRDGNIQQLEESWMGAAENIVVIRNGDLVLGKLCKVTLGAGPSLVHILWKDIGPWASAKFVSDAQRIGNVWNAVDSMCVGIRECIISEETEHVVDDIVGTCIGKVDAIADMKFPDDVKEARISSLLQDVLRRAGTTVLQGINPNSALSTLVTCGAKGTALNLAQIMGVLGQQSVGGTRVQHMPTRLGRRGLICFKPGDTSPEAKGFISTSFMMGQTPSEFFHAAMAGREGIVTTAVETANTGYNQRKMVKMSEGEVIANDGTVRITSGDIVAYHYGGDGYDATRLERVKMNFYIYMSDEALKEHAKDWEFLVCYEARRILRYYTKPIVPGEYSSQLCLPFQPSRINESMFNIEASTPLSQSQHSQWIMSTLREILSAHKQSCPKTPNQFLTLLRTTTSAPWAKSVACILMSWTSSFFARNNVGEKRASWLKHDLLKKVQNALVAAGEAVGTVGATSIGEPSTQGALNTFHFSGILEKNGTTGAKRFKELIANTVCTDTCVMHALVESKEEGDEVLKGVKGIKFYSVVDSSHIFTREKPSPLQQRESEVLPWIQSWMVPLSNRVEVLKHIEQTVKPLTPTESNWNVIEINLNKIACLREYLTPKQCAEKIRVLLQDSCLVTFSQEFEAEWKIRVLPLPCEQFLSDTGQFSSLDVCEAILDAFLNGDFYISGLDTVSDTFNVTSKVDTLQAGGGLIKKSCTKIGSVGVDLKSFALRLRKPELLWTNDIHQTEEYFGIEAAIQMINSELQRALSVDSYVDSRHTLLLSETMSRCGSIIALNRNNMENLGASTLACAAFERTLPVLEEAAFYGLKDPLRGSLERQILGLPLRVGTGIVGIVSENRKTARPVVLAPLKSETKQSNSRLAPLQKETIPSVSSVIVSSISRPQESGWSPYVSAPFPQPLIPCAKLLHPITEKWIQTLQQEYHSCTLRVEITNAKTPNFYLDLQKCLDNYLGWDNPSEFLSWESSTEVQWTVKGGAEKTCTISKLTQAAETGKASKIHLQKLASHSTLLHLPFGNLVAEAKLMHYKPVSTDLVPDSIVPDLVIVRQKKEYVKDGWTYTLSRRWRDSCVLHCEAKQFTEEPEHSFSVSTSSLQVLHTFPSLHLNEIFLAKLQACV
jgi:DNA-directed RNA polymerase II subunit RPB1